MANVAARRNMAALLYHLVGGHQCMLRQKVTRVGNGMLDMEELIQKGRIADKQIIDGTA
jgi:hypothetical protein